MIIILSKRRLAWLDVFAPNKTQILIDKKQLAKRKQMNNFPAPQFLKQTRVSQIH